MLVIDLETELFCLMVQKMSTEAHLKVFLYVFELLSINIIS